MKKIILVLGFSLLNGIAFGEAFNVWLASHTATADTAQPLCTQANKTRRGVLHGVCVNDASAQAGSVSVFNSSSTAVNPVAVLRSTYTATSGCQFYDVSMSSGIVYTNSTTNDVTIMYQCY